MKYCMWHTVCTHRRAVCCCTDVCVLTSHLWFYDQTFVPVVGQVWGHFSREASEVIVLLPWARNISEDEWASVWIQAQATTPPSTMFSLIIRITGSSSWSPHFALMQIDLGLICPKNLFPELSGLLILQSSLCISVHGASCRVFLICCKGVHGWEYPVSPLHSSLFLLNNVPSSLDFGKPELWPVSVFFLVLSGIMVSLTFYWHNSDTHVD